MKLVATSKREQNLAAIDPWTMVHFAAGLAAGLVEMPAGRAIACAAAYEVVEQLGERNEAVQDFFETSHPEHWTNVAVDLVVFAAGHWLGRRWNASGRGRRRSNRASNT